MKKPFYFLLLFLAQITFSLAQDGRVALTNWWLYKAELGSAYEAFRLEKYSQLPVFEKVSVPHCYNAFDAVSPDTPYYQGPAWYYTFVEINNPYQGGRTVLHFEGAGQEAEVYLFTQKIAKHIGGYDEWSVDITEAVDAFRENYPNGIEKVPAGMIPIAVRVDNSRDVNRIPSDLSDFTVYGGLYRNVYVLYHPNTFFKQVHCDYTLENNFKKVDINIKALLGHASISEGLLQLHVDIYDEQHNIIVSSDKSLEHWNGERAIFSLSFKNPHLWSPDQPYLYTIKISLTSNGVSETIKFKTGFRQFEFKEKGPFFLNGKRLLLTGTSRHEDYAGTGAAATKLQMRREMIMMKEMGVNFIRLGHYQQSDYILDLCDSLGFLAWEEIPWCRGGLGNKVYRQQAKRMLTNLINQHYNHSSVIIWGLGNENDWPGDFPEFEKDSIVLFMEELNKLAHKLDSNRKTAIRRCDFCKHVVDVYSPSIWAGWYRGKFTDYRQVSYDEAMQVDHFLHAEWGASMQPGRHSENPDKGLAQIARQDKSDERSGDFLFTGGDARVSKDGDWSETYACNLIDWTLKEQEKMDWLTGTAFWIFKDFATPLRPGNPIPYVNEKGVVQRDLTPKESYYVFQSYWSDLPMAHIYGHGWETRWGEPEENKLIKVYSNCDKAELFLNGKSLGIRKRNSQNFPAAGLRWKTTFVAGNNIVKVIATKGQKIINDSISFNYQIEKWGKPEKLKAEEVSVTNDSILICVKVYDTNDVFCADAKNVVRFGITGNGELIDNLGTLLGSKKIQLSNGKACIWVKLEGEAVASITSEGLVSSFLKLSINN